MAKDLSYSVEEASQRGVHLQTAAAALSVYRQAIAEGYGDEDFSAVTKLAGAGAHS
jgi:3-hydroxyisobutyrate dehydrogenase-like beta-hydroxyacid dehydrogenase